MNSFNQDQLIRPTKLFRRHNINKDEFFLFFAFHLEMILPQLFVFMKIIVEDFMLRTDIWKSEIENLMRNKITQFALLLQFLIFLLKLYSFVYFDS